jgi:hypothetical protein
VIKIAILEHLKGITLGVFSNKNIFVRTMKKDVPGSFTESKYTELILYLSDELSP